MIQFIWRPGNDRDVLNFSKLLNGSRFVSLYDLLRVIFGNCRWRYLVVSQCYRLNEVGWKSRTYHCLSHPWIVTLNFAECSFQFAGNPNCCFHLFACRHSCDFDQWDETSLLRHLPISVREEISLHGNYIALKQVPCLLALSIQVISHCSRFLASCFLAYVFAKSRRIIVRTHVL